MNINIGYVIFIGFYGRSRFNIKKMFWYFVFLRFYGLSRICRVGNRNDVPEEISILSIFYLGT